MYDQIFDREYQAGRAALNDGIGRMIDGVGQTLRVLHRINFDAPWKQRPSAKPRRAKAA